MIGDPKAKGMKFKNYDIHLTKNEVKQNKIIDKATKAINDLDVATTFDKIALQSLEKMRDGADSTLKKIAQQKTIAADGQSAILDIADHFKIKPDELAKGKIVQDKEAMKKAMFGAKMETAQNGKTMKYDPEFENFINQAMQLEQANSSAAGNYRGGGFNYGTNNPALDTPAKAKDFYYKNYWSKVKDLPAGLRTRALQLAINTGDPYGELMVASGKMSVADRAATKNQRKDKAITGNKDWEANKKAILSEYNKDPQAFLSKLDSEQNRYYDSIIANNPSSINSDTRKEFFDDYIGLARYASQPYISQQQSLPMSAPAAPVVPIAAAVNNPTPMATGISPSSIGDLTPKERKAMAIANGIKNYTGTKAQNMKLASVVNQASSNPIMNPGQGILANAPLPAFDMFKGISPFAANPVAANPAASNIVDDSGYVPSNELVDARQFADPSAYAPIDMQQSKALAQENVGAKSNISNQENKGAGNDLLNTGLSTLRSLAPFMKQTSQRPLNPDQLLPAYMALSMNQLKPVQAQFYNPMLQAQPYRVSLQDQRNEVNAQARAAFKQSVGNPSAAAMIAANASDAINKINAEENRANQAETMRAAETNRGEINEASRLNLAIGDKQMERQSIAESLTKQEALGAAKWFAEAAAENRKANNRQAVLENMYPAISFTKSGVAYKDPLYTTLFNMPDVGTGATSKEEITTPFNFLKGDETKKASKADKVVSRNGAIVKAIKGL